MPCSGCSALHGVNPNLKKALFTWNSENNMESIGYEIKKKKAATTKVGVLWHFLPGNNIRPNSKRNNKNNNNNNNNGNNNNI